MTPDGRPLSRASCLQSVGVKCAVGHLIANKKGSFASRLGKLHESSHYQMAMRSVLFILLPCTTSRSIIKINTLSTETY